MLITAIVNNRGNTLVVDMPRDRMDLDTPVKSAKNTPKLT